MNKTMVQLRDWLKGNQVTEVECVISDLTGVARGKISPVDKFLREQGMRLPESVLLQTVTGDWLDDDVYYRLLDPADIDMVCLPAEQGAFLLPWAPEPTALIFHDVYNHNGEPISLSPRNLLKQVLRLYADKGWRVQVAPEMEFYLTAPCDDPDLPLQPPIGRSGRPESRHQGYAIEAINEFDPLFEDMYSWCEIQGLEIDTLSHEEGTAQMEINFLHGDPLVRADQVMLFKRTLREAALKHGMLATFMAKPISNEPGSSMHLHQSVLRADGRNLFATEADGAPSPVFYHFLGGLQRYIPELLPLLAPNVNSFRRFLPDTSAPINLDWGHANRTCGLRIPDSDSANLRVENRLAGADANSYLAMTASLLAGYIGIDEQLEPTAGMRGRANNLARHSLPLTLEAALERLSTSQTVRRYLGDAFVDGYVAVKYTEQENFKRVISSWEREYLLASV